MKVTIFVSLCLALFVASSAKHLHGDINKNSLLVRGEILNTIESNNYVDDVVSDFVEKLRKTAEVEEPIRLPYLPQQHIGDTNVNIDITLSNVIAHDVESFVVNNLSYYIFGMKEDFDITIPNIEFNGNYNGKGKILNKNVEGTGNFNASGKNLRVWGTIYLHLVDSYVQVRRIAAQYTVEDVTGSVTGITVEGLTEQQVNEKLSNSLKKYFTDNKRLVTKTAIKAIIPVVNKIIWGETLTGMLEWMKNYQPPTKRG